MADKPIKTERGRKPKARKFYRMGPDLRVGGAPGYRVENVMTLTGGRPVLVPPEGRRGFPEYPEVALLIIDRKLGRALRDLELCESYWLVSDHMKSVSGGSRGCCLRALRGANGRWRGTAGLLVVRRRSSVGCGRRDRIATANPP